MPRVLRASATRRRFCYAPSVETALAASPASMSVPGHAPAYDPAMSMREARAVYFRAAGFSEDGGYSARWVTVKLGPVPIVFPNLPSRVRAVRLHDLHHILTGYRTDNPGEFEISAWEIASGCKDYWAAWFLNLSGMIGGLYRCPVRTFRAFVRGRHEGNFYGRDPEALLDRAVGELRGEMGVTDTVHAATAKDIAQFVFWTCVGGIVGLAWLVPPALLVALAWWLLA